MKNKALEMIQTWAHAFERETSYRVVPDTYHTLRAEGYSFPDFNAEAEAMFVADKAPEWEDGSVCNRCRVSFSKWSSSVMSTDPRSSPHHQEASLSCMRPDFLPKVLLEGLTPHMNEKSNPRQTHSVPKYGIEKEVRVCDRCFDELSGGAVARYATVVDIPLSNAYVAVLLLTMRTLQSWSACRRKHSSTPT